MTALTDAQLCESHGAATDAAAVSALPIETNTSATSTAAASPASTAATTPGSGFNAMWSRRRSTSKAIAAAIASLKQQTVVPIAQLWALNKPDLGWLALGLLGAAMAGVAPALEAYVVVHFLVRGGAHTCSLASGTHCHVTLASCYMAHRIVTCCNEGCSSVYVAC